ncbi:MAG: helix-turn-helix domain-containing protein [Alphaproteobacteria bacterium]
MPRFTDKDIDELIGGRIRQRRDDLGLTQSDLAEAVRMSFQQIQKYESGKNKIAASLLLEVSWHLCVPITYFFAAADVSN